MVNWFRRDTPTAAQQEAELQTGTPTYIREHEQAAKRDALATLERWQSGQMPDNESLQRYMNQLQRSEAFLIAERGEMTLEGQEVMNALREWLIATQELLLSKNQDELLQQFVYHVSLAISSTRVLTTTTRDPGRIHISTSKREIWIGGTTGMVQMTRKEKQLLKQEQMVKRNEIRRALWSLVNFMRLMMTSVNTRELVREIMSVTQVFMGAEDTESTGGKGTPPIQLRSRSDSAIAATPSIRASGRVQVSDETDFYHARGSHFQEESKTYSAKTSTVPTPAADDNETIRHFDQSLASLARRLEGTGTNTSFRASIQTTSTSLPSELSAHELHRQLHAVPMGASTTGEEQAQFKRPLTPNVKDVAQEMAPILESSQMERQQRELWQTTQLIDRLRRLLTSMMESPELIQSLQGLMDTSSLIRSNWMQQERKAQKVKKSAYRSRKSTTSTPASRVAATVTPSALSASRAAAKRTAGTANQILNDANFLAAFRDAQHILERLANGFSLDAFLKALQQLSQSMQTDYALKDYILDWRSFLKRCLRRAVAGDNLEYLQSAEYEQRCSYLLERGRELRSSSARHAHLFRTLRLQLQQAYDAWQQDPVTAKWQKKTRALYNALFIGGGGSGNMFSMILPFRLPRPALWSDLRQVILPMFLRDLQYLPIPRLEIVDKNSRLILDQIMLTTSQLLPKTFDIESSQSLHMTQTQSTIKVPWEYASRVRLGGIHADLQNIQFAYERWGGGIPFKDAGKVDLSMPGRGLSVVVDVAVGQFKNSMLQVRQVNCRVHRLKVHLHGTKRDGLYRLTKIFWAPSMKRQLEKSIEMQIRSSLESVGRRFYSVQSMVMNS